MSQKADIAEVIAFSDKLNSSSTDISQGVVKVDETIKKIRQMESFTGQTATATKNYLNDFHSSVLNSFDTLFEYLELKTTKHVDSFHSKVDSSETAIVQSDYLDEISLEIEIPYKNFKNYSENIESVIENVADIVSVTQPTFYDCMADYEDADKTIKELKKGLESFISTGKGHDSTTKEIIQAIEVVMNKAKAVDGETRITDFKYGSGNKTALETKGLVSYLNKMDTVLSGAKESIIDHSAYSKKGGKHKRPPAKPHPSSVSASDKAKYVAKDTARRTGNSVKSTAGFGKGASKVLGPAGAGLNYYSNYNDAVAKGLDGKDAHIRAAEDTVIDTVIGGAVQAGFTAAGTLIPIPGVGTAVGVAAGIAVNGLLNVGFGKTKKSVMDRAKSGFQKIKGWFS